MIIFPILRTFLSKILKLDWILILYADETLSTVDQKIITKN